MSAALSMEGFRASLTPLDPRVVAARPAPGQAWAAAGLRTLLKGSALTEVDRPRRLQDPLSFRCASLVHGAIAHGARRARGGDRARAGRRGGQPARAAGGRGRARWRRAEPEILSTGNFSSPALALALDGVAIACAQVAHAIAERQARLKETRLSGLPSNLVEVDPDRAASRSGVAPLSKTAAALVLEIRHLAAPVVDPAGGHRRWGGGRHDGSASGRAAPARAADAAAAARRAGAARRRPGGRCRRTPSADGERRGTARRSAPAPAPPIGRCASSSRRCARTVRSGPRSSVWSATCSRAARSGTRPGGGRRGVSLELTYLNGPAVAQLALADEEILQAVRAVLAAQGRGETVGEPRTHLFPRGAAGHFNVLRGATPAIRRGQSRRRLRREPPARAAIRARAAAADGPDDRSAARGDRRDRDHRDADRRGDGARRRGARPARRAGARPHRSARDRLLERAPVPRGAPRAPGGARPLPPAREPGGVRGAAAARPRCRGDRLRGLGVVRAGRRRRRRGQPPHRASSRCCGPTGSRPARSSCPTAR